MTATMSEESLSMLEGYRRGLRSNSELAEWLAQAEYNDTLSAIEKDALAGLRLIVVESIEGRRPNDEVLESVSALLAKEVGDSQLLTKRTSSATSWPTGSKVTAATSPVRLVDISPGKAI